MSVDGDWTTWVERPAVYRLLDSDGTTLYVGVSTKPAARLEHHRSLGRIPFTTAVIARPSSDLAALLQIESELIERLKPPFNVAKNYKATSFKAVALAGADQIGDQEAFETFRDLRWPTGVVCPYCNHDGQMYFTASRRVWQCQSCLRQFRVTTETIFADHKVRLTTWITAASEVRRLGDACGAIHVMRATGVTYKVAHGMLVELRRSPVQDEAADMIGGLLAHR